MTKLIITNSATANTLPVLKAKWIDALQRRTELSSRNDVEYHLACTRERKAWQDLKTAENIYPSRHE